MYDKIHTCEDHSSSFLLNRCFFADSGWRNDIQEELLSPTSLQQSSAEDFEGVERMWQQHGSIEEWRGECRPTFDGNV